MAESDSDTKLGFQQISVCHHRTSSNKRMQKIYASPSRQMEYCDDLNETQKWIETPDVLVQSRQPISRPVSLSKLISDGLSLISVFLIWLLLKYVVKPVRRSFLCSDSSLYHPLSVKNVFPIWLLLVCAIIIPLIVIILSESIRWHYVIRKKAAKVVYQIKIRQNIYNIPEWIGDLYIIIGVFLFANCTTSFLTNVGKVSAGRLRPHFIPSCFHEYTYKSLCRYPYDWITNYTCLGELNDVVKEKDGPYDIHQSFPSGHASTAFCGLIFLALYIHKVWNYRHIGLFPYVIEILCFALAAYISITRITDHRHHATDVLGGGILGIAVAIIAFHSMIASFKRSDLLHHDNRSSTD